MSSVWLGKRIWDRKTCHAGRRKARRQWIDCVLGRGREVMPVPAGTSPKATGDGEQAVLQMDSVYTDIGQARKAVEEHLAPACSWVDMGGVLLVVSELVTNAQRHARGQWQLRVQAEHDRVRVEVTDTVPLPPRWRPGRLDGSGGWGLCIAEQCADTLEVLTSARGKTMRAQWLHPGGPGAAFV
ncbi:ATP-binding protein [Streptomyces sp. HNM0575]|uniref:ATP-binding protein n=1 Tax=Streptomyces sp. HNM0575 TaxID=2716338 RepID=UPI00145E4D3E|nr:ATP-binding protein [Streptomyces sp. HNM0575]NLU71939.1 ATP-binding protein [Streptomyces sp. HNM0575]